MWKLRVHWSRAQSVGLTVVGLTLAVLEPSLAQENPFSINGQPLKHPSESVMGVDQVDPLSGNLLLAHTDLLLPGNAGLDLRVTRYYNSNIYRHFADADYTYEEHSWVGVGWRLHFGRILHPDSLVPGAVQVEMPDGSRHPVYQVSTRPVVALRRLLPVQPDDPRTEAAERAGLHVQSPVLGGRWRRTRGHALCHRNPRPLR